MLEPDFAGANGYALARLRGELPSALAYHCLPHTCDDVVPAVERFAALEGVTGTDLELLRTAAYYHDLGFVEGPHDHEATSARIARQVLPRFGFAAAQVAAIEGMILATRLPQQPHTLLEEILADADLDLLGRDDFLPRNAALRVEAAALGAEPSDGQWYCGQLRFLQSHHYWTAAAEAERGAKKLEHIEAMAQLCAQTRAATPPPTR